MLNVLRTCYFIEIMRHHIEYTHMIFSKIIIITLLNFIIDIWFHETHISNIHLYPKIWHHQHIFIFLEHIPWSWKCQTPFRAYRYKFIQNNHYKILTYGNIYLVSSNYHFKHISVPHTMASSLHFYSTYHWIENFKHQIGYMYTIFSKIWIIIFYLYIIISILFHPTPISNIYL